MEALSLLHYGFIVSLNFLCVSLHDKFNFRITIFVMRSVKRVALVSNADGENFFAQLVKKSAEHRMEVCFLNAGEFHPDDSDFDYQNVAVVSHVSMNNFDAVIFSVSQWLKHRSSSYFSSYIKSFGSLPCISAGCVLEDVPSVVLDDESSEGKNSQLSDKVFELLERIFEGKPVDLVNRIKNSEIRTRTKNLLPESERMKKLSVAVNSFTQLDVDLSLNKFRRTINDIFRGIGIRSSAVVLFEAPVETYNFDFFPLPSKAFVYTSYDSDCRFFIGSNTEPYTFDPRQQIVPGNIFSSFGGKAVFSLYRRNFLYGYVIMDSFGMDYFLCRTICRLFSSVLSSAYSLTQYKIQHRELEKEFDEANFMSLTDEMTGLFNRRGFHALGQQMLDVAVAGHKSCIVFFGDIDGLKKINDTYGHAAGDRAITAEAEILTKVFRSSDIICRYGGDEYAIVAPGMTSDKVEDIRTKIYDACRSWNEVSAEKFKLSISLGFSALNLDSPEPDINVLLEKADSCLYAEKKKHKTMAS